MTKDLTNQEFGRFTVLRRALRTDEKDNHYWICKCECGRVTNVRGGSLLNGLSKSCGCLRSEASSARLKAVYAAAARGKEL